MSYFCSAVSFFFLLFLILYFLLVLSLLSIISWMSFVFLREYPDWAGFSCELNYLLVRLISDALYLNECLLSQFALSFLVLSLFLNQIQWLWFHICHFKVFHAHDRLYFIIILLEFCYDFLEDVLGQLTVINLVVCYSFLVSILHLEFDNLILFIFVKNTHVKTLVFCVIDDQGSTDFTARGLFGKLLLLLVSLPYDLFPSAKFCNCFLLGCTC